MSAPALVLGVPGANSGLVLVRARTPAAEIEHLDLLLGWASSVDNHIEVVRFQIAMNDANGMRGGQGRGGLPGMPHRLVL